MSKGEESKTPVLICFLFAFIHPKGYKRHINNENNPYKV